MKYKKFVILVCSYNNARWYEKSLLSILNQDYPYFRVIYTDDCSTDQTAELVEQYLSKNDPDGKVSLVKNSVNLKPVGNIYYMAHSCRDDEILVNVDGDDWLQHENVLTRLNEVYQDDNVWMTWGSYIDYPSSKKGLGSLPISDEVIENHSYRSHRWSYSHLRSFRAWLFKKISKIDLRQKGEFFQMAGDLAFMFPMVEMSGGRFKYINEILYVYNHENPLQEHKIDESLQLEIDAKIRKKTPYRRLENSAQSGINLFLRLNHWIRQAFMPK